MTRRRDVRLRPGGGRRRHFTHIERLEGRRLLSASPGPEYFSESRAAVFAPYSIQPADAIEPTDGGPASPATDNAVQPPAAPHGKAESVNLLAIVLPPPPFVTGAAGVDSPGETAIVVRVAVLVVEFDPSAETEQSVAQEDLPPDPRAPYPVVAHDSPDADRSATLPVEYLRVPTGDMAGNGAALEVQQRSAASLVLPGSSAESSAAMVGTMAPIGDVPRASKADDRAAWNEAESAPQHAAVSHLVAFSDAADAWATGATVASVLAQDGEWDLAATALHELLVPQFALDRLLIDTAISDLLSDADEWGASLFDMLTGTISSGEVALVTGALAAGLVYRQWRGAGRREQAEAWRMLSARFITGPESLRLGRRIVE